MAVNTITSTIITHLHQLATPSLITINNSPASYWITGIQHFQDDISSSDNLLELFVVRLPRAVCERRCH